MEVGKQGRIYRLKCSVQNYDWGRIGSESTVAKLFSLNSKVEIKEDKPYAEMWKPLLVLCFLQLMIL
ncbi:hypothetical protein LguiB_017501 [Lonicera macranthoides]